MWTQGAPMSRLRGRRRGTAAVGGLLVGLGRLRKSRLGLKVRTRLRRGSAHGCRIDLAGNEHHHPAAMTDPAGGVSSLVAGPEIQVGPRRSDNGRSGILGNHESIKGNAGAIAAER